MSPVQARPLVSSGCTERPNYTIVGMEGELADYMKVIAAMKGKMAGTSKEERHEVEEASKVLRRLRAGAAMSGPVGAADARCQASGPYRVTGKRTSADVLRGARKRDSLAKRS